MVFGGLTPALPQRELVRKGYCAVLYANAVLQAALKSVREVLGALKHTGPLDEVRERLTSCEDASARSQGALRHASTKRDIEILTRRGALYPATARQPATVILPLLLFLQSVQTSFREGSRRRHRRW